MALALTAGAIFILALAPTPEKESAMAKRRHSSHGAAHLKKASKRRHKGHSKKSAIKA